MKQAITEAIIKALVSLQAVAPEEASLPGLKITVERPADMTHGDYSTNVAMVYGPKMKQAPRAFAEALIAKLEEAVTAGELSGIGKIEPAGPGFINFYIQEEVLLRELRGVLDQKDAYGRVAVETGKKIIFDYTNPNPFKVFHIGHLMANAIGESLTRLAEANGAEVKRFNYQGDVGRHVALTLWGLRFMPDPALPADSVPLSERVAFFGKAYSLGATEYKRLEELASVEKELSDDILKNSEFKKAEAEVQLLNRRIYAMTAGEPDESGKDFADIREAYERGKQWSLDAFEVLYKILGTKFDQYFFESSAALVAKKIVEENIAPNGKAVFEESNGAIIFPGEKYGLHTRVMSTKHGLLTYEGKEMGLAAQKHDACKYDLALTVTGNEQNGYFEVVFKALELVFPEIGSKNEHVGHGMLVLTTGKMGSRTGNVITGESLILDMIEQALEKMSERDLPADEKKKVAEEVAVAAIKYSILRQSSGKNIVFDPAKSLSFEGDSGPYLQYSYVRSKAVLSKAAKEGVTANLSAGVSGGPANEQEKRLQKLLVRLPETIERAWADRAPHHVANYLMELAGTFSSYYASTQIVNKEDAASPSRVALVEAFSVVMRNGLTVLGIKVPERM